MGAVLGELLPLAIGVVLSPAAIIIVIVMLGVPRGWVRAAAFITGWIGALLAVVWKAWLGESNATIMALLLVLFGAILVGKGIGALA